MADQFRIKRKQDGAVFGPITATEAKTFAGFPEDFDRLEDGPEGIAVDPFPGRLSADEEPLNAPKAAKPAKAPSAPASGRRGAKARTSGTKPAGGAPAKSEGQLGEGSTSEGGTGAGAAKTNDE